MNESDLRVLLLQVRADEETRLEEFNEFVRFSGLLPEQIQSLNVFEVPSFTLEVLAGFDALFVGGSSDVSVLEPGPYTESVFALLKYCVNEHIPVFASCYGFQAAVVALGGEIITDEAHMEMGVYDIGLTPEGKHDPLFEGISSPFKAIAGHTDRVKHMPPNRVALAYTEACPCHAFMVAGTPFYAFQFHPEIDMADFVARLERYQDRYPSGAERLAALKGQTVDTSDANSLLRRFVERILMPHVTQRSKTSALAGE